MRSSKGRQPVETIKDPHLLSTRDLFEMSLSRLSKGLSLTTSPQSTLEVYVRWLEVHRNRPSDVTKQWENTIWQWSQSLRARGILKQDIIHEVEDWKDKFGPFREFQGRYPPEKYEIERAFKDLRNDKLAVGIEDSFEKREERREDSTERTMIDRVSSSKRVSRNTNSMLDCPPPSKSQRDEKELRGESRFMPDRALHSKWGDESPYQGEHVRLQPQNKSSLENFQNPPSNSYICNRCGIKGHYLQVCPTNMDPAFDNPPDSSYLCSICGARGKHYKSLCPRNYDPHSIIQRRAAQGLQSSPVLPSLQLDDYLQEELIGTRRNDRKHTQHGTECDSSRGRTDSRIPAGTEKSQEIQIIDKRQGRLQLEAMVDLSKSGYARKSVVESEDAKNVSRKRALSASTDEGSPTTTLPSNQKKIRGMGPVTEPPDSNMKIFGARVMANEVHTISEDLESRYPWPPVKGSSPLSLCSAPVGISDETGGKDGRGLTNPEDIFMTGIPKHSYKENSSLIRTKSASNPSPGRKTICKALKYELVSRRKETRETDKDVEDLIKDTILKNDAREQLSHPLFGSSISDEPQQHECSDNIEILNVNPDEILLDSDHDYIPKRVSDNGQITPDLGGIPVSIATQIQNVIDSSSGESSESGSEEEGIISTTFTANNSSKKYSEFVQQLMVRHEEMNHVVNKVKKRPSAAIIWKRANESRRQSTTTVSTSASPTLSVESKTYPLTLDDCGDYEIHEISAVEVTKRLDKGFFVERDECGPLAHMDGAYERHPPKSVEPGAKSSPRTNKLSEFRKGAFEKVMNVTSRDFPSLRLRGRSKTLAITTQSEPLSRSPTPPTPCPKDDVRPPLAPKSTNVSRVLITSLPAQLYNKDLPQIPSSRRISHQPGSSTALLPVDEQHTSNRIEKTLLLHYSTSFGARNSSQDSALSISRSTSEFRSTVRRIIEGSNVYEHPSQSADNLMLQKPKVARPAIIRSMSAAPGDHKIDVHRKPAEEATEVTQVHKVKQQQIEFTRARIYSENDSERRARIANFKQFSSSFRLGSPIPVNLNFLKGSCSKRKSVGSEAPSSSERKTSTCRANSKEEHHVGKAPADPSFSGAKSLEGLKMFTESLKLGTPSASDIKNISDHRSTNANKIIALPTYEAAVAGSVSLYPPYVPVSIDPFLPLPGSFVPSVNGRGENLKSQGGSNAGAPLRRSSKASSVSTCDTRE